MECSFTQEDIEPSSSIKSITIRHDEDLFDENERLKMEIEDIQNKLHLSEQTLNLKKIMKVDLENYINNFYRNFSEEQEEKIQEIYELEKKLAKAKKQRLSRDITEENLRYEYLNQIEEMKNHCQFLSSTDIDTLCSTGIHESSEDSINAREEDGLECPKCHSYFDAENVDAYMDHIDSCSI